MTHTHTTLALINPWKRRKNKKKINFLPYNKNDFLIRFICIIASYHRSFPHQIKEALKWIYLLFYNLSQNNWNVCFTHAATLWFCWFIIPKLPLKYIPIKQNVFVQSINNSRVQPLFHWMLVRNGCDVGCIIWRWRLLK